MSTESLVAFSHEEFSRSFADRRGASHTSRKKALMKMVVTRFRLYWGRLGYIEHVPLDILSMSRGWLYQACPAAGHC